MTKVTCTHCKEESRTNAAETLNIEEDFQWLDLLTFVCPKCGKSSKSYVRGGYVEDLP